MFGFKLLEDALVVESPLDEVDLDQQGFAVKRHELAVDRLSAVADLPDLLDLFIRLRRAPHHRWGGDGAAQHSEITSCAVPDRGDLVVVDASDPVHRLSHIVDLLEDFFGEDVALLDPEHDVDVVCSAELGREFEVDLHERVPVGQQVVEGGGHLHAQRLVSHHGREEGGNHRHRHAVLQELGAQVERGFA